MMKMAIFYKLFLEMFDFRKDFLYNFVFAHVDSNSRRHYNVFIRGRIETGSEF